MPTDRIMINIHLEDLTRTIKTLRSKCTDAEMHPFYTVKRKKVNFTTVCTV